MDAQITLCDFCLHRDTCYWYEEYPTDYVFACAAFEKEYRYWDSEINNKANDIPSE